MSYTFTDKGGFEWDKMCQHCNYYHPNGKPVGRNTKDVAYCSEYDAYHTEEGQFRRYLNAGLRNNDCPRFYKTDSNDD
jgi:hypothetical protein